MQTWKSYIFKCLGSYIKKEYFSEQYWSYLWEGFISASVETSELSDWFPAESVPESSLRCLVSGLCRKWKHWNPPDSINCGKRNSHFIIVISKEVWVCVAAIILLLVWHHRPFRLFLFIYLFIFLFFFSCGHVHPPFFWYDTDSGH